ncbi:TraB/GumN family protein [Sphingomonas sp. MMS24-J13]|uniref:TraB/GumN family protein n=1 Tax=Sphingomonas sp. MMS24-J13 TaxID=3238686 RepID=UPI00384D4DB4
MRLRLLAPLLLLLAAAPAPHKAHPALWRLSDADTTIWLFGTIHALPAGYSWRDPSIETAMEHADALTLETVIDQDPGKLATILYTLGKGDGLPPLADRVPVAKRARLAQLIKATGLPPTALDGMKSWAAAVVLTGVAMQEIGVGAQDGVETQLTSFFRGKSEPVDGFETPEQQLGFFNALPQAAQDSFLIATLDSPAKAKAEFAEMVGAWSKGDVKAIARAFADDPEFTPALREILVRHRNAAWAAALQQRMARPGTSFVAVGAGHLAGPDSLIEMLRAKGLKVERAD